MRHTLRAATLTGILGLVFSAAGATPVHAQGFGLSINVGRGGYAPGYGYSGYRSYSQVYNTYGGGYGQNGGGYGQGYYGGGYNQGYYGGGYNQAGYGGGYGQGYGVPTTAYYGNGGHDLQPHLHNTQTPTGNYVWYGNGAHDLQPHEHTQSPYTGYRSYSANPFGGVTTSYHNSTPYVYMPW